MACHGVAVLQFELDLTAQKDAVADLEKTLQPLIRQRTQQGTKIILVLALGRLSARAAIDVTGKVTAITDNGTFIEGKAALQQFVVAAARAQGITISGERFETHRHDKAAPQQAYSTPLSQR